MMSVEKKKMKPAWLYRQSGVIPFRVEGCQVEVLLITTRRNKRWVIPKGVVEKHLSPSASAVQEAWEEAGVKGDVTEASVGSYSYDKWNGTCTVEVFPMRVTEVFEEWPEDCHRTREWFPVAGAACRVENNALRALLAGFANRGIEVASEG